MTEIQTEATTYLGRPLAVQLAVALLAMVAAVAAPASSGTMLLVPLTAGGRDALVATALGRGARIVSAGPLAHSLVVRGDRARLAPALLAAGVLPLRAAAAGCDADRSLPR